MALKGIPGMSQLIGKSQNWPIEAPVAYWESDARQDHKSRVLLKSNWLGDPVMQQTGIQLTCWLLNTADVYGALLAYSIWLGYDSSMSCSCADFQQHGRACKHMHAAIVHTCALQDWALSQQLNVPIVYMPYIELLADKASATWLHIYTNQYVLVDHQGAASSDTNKWGPAGDSNPCTAVAQVAHCINEALQGGFLGDLGNPDKEGVVNMGDNENLEAVECVVKGETDKDDTDNRMLLLSDYNFNEFSANSMCSLAEQLIVQTSYDIKKNMKLIPNIHAALDHINYCDLEASKHQAIYKEYANKLKLLSMRIRGLLRCAGPSAPPTAAQGGVQALSQHNTATTLL
ncbi:hypothetical protein B0J17DRAFT_725145 [Rhizoctonia solani]|nr:hypothetical protein B0J17DRAFT_725145 [Rhizoctonia solani]